MSIFGLCMKNIFHNKARALTLGIFVLAIAFMIVMSNAFSFTVREGMQDLVISSATGHVQFRPVSNPEKDMLSVENPWEGAGKYLISAETLRILQDLVSQRVPGAVLVPRIRATGMLVSDTDTTGALLLATDTSDRFVGESFRLTSGRMLQPGDDHCIVLPTAIATNLNAKVGDTLGLMGQSQDGYSADVGLTVVGVGDPGMTWKYGFNFDSPYIDLAAARELLGIDGGATDAVLYLQDKRQTAAVARLLGPALDAALPQADRLKTTTYDKMGSFITAAQSIYGITNTFFIVIIMVIAGIVTMNIIFMMGLERRQEIGTMRAIGFSRGRIVGLFVVEIFIISIFFGALGTGAALGLVKWLSGITFTVTPPMSYSTGSEFRFLFNPDCALPIIVFVPAFAFLASLYPSLRASRERPADTLREW